MTYTSEQEYLAQYQPDQYPTPLLTVDMAIFAVRDGQLQVLLIQRSNYPAKDQWALPGGFVDLNADPDLMASAQRKLFEKTAIKSPYLEQVSSVGNATRDPRGWSVTVLYFALIDADLLDLAQEHQAFPVETTQWLPIDQARRLDLAFDHLQLLELAVERLSSRSRYTALPLSLMPELFTLTELQHIYEIILGQKLEKKSFRRRMLDAEMVIETDQTKIAGKRPAQLFRAARAHDDFHFARILEYPRHTVENSSN
ncbi:ADP-ribose pyrophosphatase YjhB (NUDIX family) [Acinetobacter calcoaceticus]|uniref:ADP-ribose pyrophosphatase YjhB (NUDIX family) n=1 Tax=Acinetobacter calcoaceticus TaxID=471 RepID=A0A4R1XWA8_ACICA|nr:ADP-ribose pyrophosphatase YjhB (NUDIX family) [Acinetobacter calcoaceticus]